MTRSRAKKIPAVERRCITVEAVIDLAGATNPNDITTAAIAQHMNLTQGAIFRHFPTKAAIWQAVMTWVSENLLARLESAAAGIDSPLERMDAMFRAHVAFVRAYPGVPRMLFGELQSPCETPARRVARTLMTGYAARLRDLIEAGKARGEICADLDGAAAATLFIGTIQGLVMQSLIAGDMSRMDEDARRAFAIYRRGIAAEETGMGGN